VDRALGAYRRLQWWATRGHARHIADFSRVRPPRLIERLLFSAAARDGGVRRALLGYLAREIGVTGLMSPAVLLRALGATLRPSRVAAQRPQEVPA
jgi:hypothetical protein